MLGLYERIIVVILFLLTVVFVRNAIKLYQQAGVEEDKRLRRAIRRKSIPFMSLGLMAFFSALYIILRVSWLFLIVVLIGSMATTYVIGSGIGANMKEH